VTLLTEDPELQAQIWAIVGDTNPPLIDLIELKPHNHDGTDTVKIPSGSLVALSVDTPELAAAAVETSKLAADAVDDNIVGNRVPALSMRQGGSPTIWKVPGDTNYYPGMIRMQCGTKDVPFTGGQSGATVAVTFPHAFSNLPIVFCGIGESLIAVRYGDNPSVWADNISTTGFYIEIDLYNETFMSSSELAVFWLAIGPE